MASSVNIPTRSDLEAVESRNTNLDIPVPEKTDMKIDGLKKYLCRNDEKLSEMLTLLSSGDQSKRVEINKIFEEYFIFLNTDK